MKAVKASNLSLGARKRGAMQKVGASLIHTSPKTISAKPVRVSLCKPILKD
jgi:hypothetical protein